MEETINTTELVYAVIAAISVSLVGGLISWKLISNKEEQRAKECAMMGEVKWNSRIKWYQKVMPGFCALLFTSFVCFVFPLILPPSPHKIDPMIMNLMNGTLILSGLIGTWTMAFLSPLFAITNDSVVIWRYYGYVRSKKYLLNELTREEYGEGSNHIVALYRGEKRVKKLYSNSYKDEKALLELLRQIPEKKD